MYEGKRMAELREKYLADRPWSDEDKLWALKMISSGIMAAESRDEYKRQLEETEARFDRFFDETLEALHETLDKSKEAVEALGDA